MLSLTKTLLSTFVLLGLCVNVSQQAVCQERKGLTGIGIQFSTPPPYVYGSTLFSVGSMEMLPDIIISTWLTDRATLEPSLGLVAYTNQTYLRLGLTFINHFGLERLSPFVLVRGKAYLTSINSNNSSDYLFGLGVGGEYFISEKFSVSGECQLNYLVPDKDRSFFIKDNITSTGVGISSRFYLN